MVDKQTPDVKHSPSETPDASASTTGRDDNGDRPKKARRTFLTQNACTRCRQKKSKCDGKRPICGRCEKHHADCVYDVAQEGITRMQNLQNQLGSKTEQHDKLQRLFDALRRGSDQEATTILARLRLGSTIDDLLAYVGEAETSSTGSQPAQSPLEPHQQQQQHHEHGQQQQQTPAFLRRWPSSPPVQEGYWTTSGEASSRTLSQSSVPQLGRAGSDSRVQTDSTLAIRDGYRQQEGQGPYFHQSNSPHGMQQGQNMPFSPVQWREGSGSPFYADAAGQRQQGQRPSR